MESIGDLLAEARAREAVAFTAPDRSTEYSAREFCTAAWKAGNLLTHYGVHEGATVTVLVGRGAPDDDSPGRRLGGTPEPLFAILGGWLLGGVVDLDPSERLEGAVVVGPPHLLEGHEVAPGCTTLVYGESPTDPATGHFERERWSENPVEPPNRVPADALAVPGAPGRTQRTLVESAQEPIADGTIRAGDRVGIDAPLGTATVAPGVLAPLAAGASIVGGDGGQVDVVVDGDGAIRLSG